MKKIIIFIVLLVSLFSCDEILNNNQDGELYITNSVYYGGNIDIDVYIDGTKKGTVYYGNTKKFIIHDEDSHYLSIYSASWETYGYLATAYFTAHKNSEIRATCTINGIHQTN